MFNSLLTNLNINLSVRNLKYCLNLIVITFLNRLAKLNEPDFDCVGENVLETWQKGNHTFKKTEYTMRLEIEGKAYFAAANTKKGAKNKVAEEAWNVIRTGTFP